MTLALHAAKAGAVRPQAVYWGAEGDVKWLSSDGCTYRLDRPSDRTARAEPAPPRQAESLRAPMPAQVRAVQVAEGDEVEAGQTLLLLEAMKMEIRLQAPRAGRIARLLAQRRRHRRARPGAGGAGDCESSGAEEVSMPGRYYDDLEVGQRIRHAQGRTVTETDNVLFCALTMNTQPLHLNEDFAARDRSSAGASSTASSRWAWWWA